MARKIVPAAFGLPNPGAAGIRGSITKNFKT